MRFLLSKLKNHWPEILILSAIVFFLKDIIFFGKIFTTPGFGLGDYNLGVIPSMDYISESLKSGRIPLWSPEFYTGYPFISDLFIFFLPNLILPYLFPIATTLNILAVSTFLMIAFFTLPKT